MQKNVLAAATVSLMLFGALAPAHASIVLFNFTDQANSTPVPFTSTIDGLSASLTSPGHYFIFDGNTGLPGIGPADVQGLGFGDPLDISFSQTIYSISFNFATQNGPTNILEPGGGGTFLGTPITLATDLNGVPAGQTTATGSLPPGTFYPQGFISFSNSSGFNNIEISPDASTDLAVGSLQADTTVPEPATPTVLSMAAILVGGLVLRRRKNAVRN